MVAQNRLWPRLSEELGKSSLQNATRKLNKINKTNHFNTMAAFKGMWQCKKHWKTAECSVEILCLASLPGVLPTTLPAPLTLIFCQGRADHEDWQIGRAHYITGKSDVKYSIFRHIQKYPCWIEPINYKRIRPGSDFSAAPKTMPFT